MNGPLAQIVGLVVFGNDHLRGHAAPENFWPRANIFKYCKSVAFVDASRENGETPYAGHPQGWFARLKDENMRGLLLHRVPRNDKDFSDRMTAGLVGGGGRWLIEAVSGEGADVWEANWKVQDQNDPERNIWKVAYGRIQAGGLRLPDIARPLDKMSAAMKEALIAIAAFARRVKEDSWAGDFEKGLAALESGEPFARTFYPEFAQSSLALPAKRLLGACMHAHVFGAMGSWNDLGFEGGDKKIYDTLSDRLFDLICHSCAAVANSAYAAR